MTPTPASSLAATSGMVSKIKTEIHQLRLFVSGMTPWSTDAIARIKAICEEHLVGCYELEVIDIYQHPTVAREEQIVATPTLIKRLPVPPRRLVGDLSDTKRVLLGLDIRGN